MSCERPGGSRRTFPRGSSSSLVFLSGVGEGSTSSVRATSTLGAGAGVACFSGLAGVRERDRVHVLLVRGTQRQTITPACGSHDYAGRQTTVEWLDDQMGLLSWSFTGDHRFDAPAQIVPRRHAGNRFSRLQGHISDLEDRADDRRNFRWPPELNSAIGHILAFEFLRALAPLSGHLDAGGFIKCERYGVILPIGQG